MRIILPSSTVRTEYLCPSQELFDCKKQTLCSQGAFVASIIRPARWRCFLCLSLPLCLGYMISYFSFCLCTCLCSFSLKTSFILFFAHCPSMVDCGWVSCPPLQETHPKTSKDERKSFHSRPPKRKNMPQATGHGGWMEVAGPFKQSIEFSYSTNVK